MKSDRMNEESGTHEIRKPGLAAGATHAVPAFLEFLIETEEANCQQGVLSPLARFRLNAGR
jgi:hypothetical protein